MWGNLIASAGAAALLAAWGVSAQAQSAAEPDSAGTRLITAPPAAIFGAVPADPFEEIGVDAPITLVDPDSIQAWAGGLDEATQAELQSLCETMTTQPLRYDIAHRTFCGTLLGS